MSESTLSITRADLKTAVARQLGITRTAGDFATEDSNAVTDIIREGERDFYGAYAWSFLQPVGTFVLSANQADYDLPDDFGGFITHELQYKRSNNAWYPLKLTSVAEILKHRGLSQLETTSFPSLAAESWVQSSHAFGQRKRLMVWPAPSAALTIEGQYSSIPSAITDTAPYPLGGQPHAGTLRAACLAAAELELDGAAGPWAAKFEKRLANSIRHEQQTGPKHLGSLNRSGRERGDRHRYSNHYVSYGGSFYLGAD